MSNKDRSPVPARESEIGPGALRQIAENAGSSFDPAKAVEHGRKRLEWLISKVKDIDARIELEEAFGIACLGDEPDTSGVRGYGEIKEALVALAAAVRLTSNT